LDGPILPYNGIVPKVDPSAFIAPGAFVIGDVEIGPESSIWYNCVVRGDEEPIRIGARSNIQDGTIIHTTSGLADTWIGDDVLIGHGSIIHGCRLENGAFVGMGSTLLDHSVIESEAMLAAGSLLTSGKRIECGQLWGGRPAKFMRPLKEKDFSDMSASVRLYLELASAHRRSLAE
jgi:carbonic anhydrase/acetyltransferase-like protein (isoleucine patch superfamily)